MISTIILFILFIVVVSTTLWLFLVSFSLWQSSNQKTFYVSTPKHIAQKMLETLDAQKGRNLIDLGAGDGSILRLSAQKHETTSVGYEITMWPYLSSILKNYLFKKNNPQLKNLVQMHYSPALDADVSEADYIFLYTSPEFNQKLAYKLKRELPTYSRIVSLTFPLPDWTAEEEITIGDYTYWLYLKAHNESERSL
ncbi:hypothetical protein KC571_02320 [candidate division WWE3 bacterium]|uniref:SAM-dependent methyltransferase n=1 Tax=candidate division WWE3 bacterium TaxID=2053526 RepID=A0A955LGL6_UNCKA|nr:hypothetical protein [candidate division WWE3 bacterium]